MENITTQFQEFIERSIRECKEQEQSLITENRKDEANLCRIKSNIYDIFGTLMKVSSQQEASSGLKAVCLSFEQKAEKVPENWKSSYEKAKAHGDAAKLLVEEEKLAVVNAVMAYYQKLKEEVQ